MGTCLVVDDSKVIRKVARGILEDLGFEVDEAANGQEALDACSTKSFDAVLLDWNMPVMNGLEFVRTVRSATNCGDPIIVFCTTENSFEEIQEAMAAGANEFVMKPFDGDIIQTKFAQVGLL